MADVSEIETLRPHVLHVSEAFGGGIQTALAQYVESSPWAEHSVVARARSGHDVGRLSGLDGVAITLFEGSILGFLNKASSMVRVARPSIVHLHSSIAGALRLHPGLTGAQIVYTPHCYAFERMDHSSFRRSVYRSFEQLCGIVPHTIAGVSVYESELGARLSLNAESVVLPNAVPSPVQLGTVRRPKSAVPRIVGVGRICPQKDPGMFAEAASLYREGTGPRCDWVWIGDGDTEVRAQLQASGVEVTGWIPNVEAVAELASASVYVHTALWEGCPIAPLEASAYGVPVLMRSTRTTKSLGYSNFDSTAGLVSALTSLLTDDCYRTQMEHYESRRRGSMDRVEQEATLRSLYGMAR